jgi:hypothetical protein
MTFHKRLTVFLIPVLLLSTFAMVFHHHENTADDHDCPICVASHHAPATSHAFMAADVGPCFIVTTADIFSQILTDNLFFISLSTRGPPA